MKTPSPNLVPDSDPADLKMRSEASSDAMEESVESAESAARGSWCPPWLLKPFQFASLAVLTQVVLLLNQVALLPIQIRVWGTGLTANFYSILAIAAVTTAADFGLRSAGHAELMRYANDNNDVAARTEFEHLWAWIRILITATTILLVGADFIYNAFYLGVSYPMWRGALVIGIALEVLLGVRLTYLDSLSLYREAEAGYLVLAAARLILALGALLIYHAPPSALGWIWFVTGVLAIVQQNRLCQRVGLLPLFQQFPPGLTYKTLAITRHTMADPSSAWVRINGPVVILTAINAQPIAIITYVALRAIYGAARTTVMQVSRYASVEFLNLRFAKKFEVAEIHLTVCVSVAAFSASCMTAAIIADNGRLASLLLHKVDIQIYQEIAITFGLASAFYAYQITQAVSRRAGEVAPVARRQYFYMICFAVFAVIAVVVPITLLWLILMLVADILVSLSFMLKPAPDSILAQTSAGRRGCVAATASSIVLFAMWAVVRVGYFGCLVGTDISSIIWSVFFLIPWILLIAGVNLSVVFGLSTKNASLGSMLSEMIQRRRAVKIQTK